MLGSCIFLFVKHPFDVGDRVDISARTLIVERISLLYCVFRDVLDQRTLQVSNIVLNTNWIDNLSRSKAMREQVTLTVDFGTSFGDIQLLKSELEYFVRDKENSRDFQPDIDIEVLGLGEMSKLELRVEIRHKSNWSNDSIRATRRSKFMCALVLAIRKVPIYGPGGGDAGLGSSSNPSYSVAISDQEAQTNRDEFGAEKESARLVPTCEMDAVLPPPDQPKTQSKTTGFQAHETPPDSGLHYRGATTASGGGPSVTPSSDTTFIEAVNTRAVATDQRRVDESDMSRTPSTGHRRANPAMLQQVSPNTPIEEDSRSQTPTPRQNSFGHHDMSLDMEGQQGPYSSNNPYAPRPGMQQAASYFTASSQPGTVPPPPQQRPAGDGFSQQQTPTPIPAPPPQQQQNQYRTRSPPH